nr:Mur ligase family protein [Chitinophagales bacterium]
MNPKVHNVYFVGIGGIGMSALARYYLLQGTKVYGYDATKTELTEELSDLGAQISYEDICQDFFQILDLVVYTPAIPETSVIFNYFKSSKIPMFKRAQVLGAISKQKNTIAVAGSHGKTTISTMISYLFYHAQIPVNAFLGGISANFNSNYLVGDSQICVVEADEYDRSFLQLSPKCIVISSIDSDHLDIYGTKEHIIQAFQDFVNLLPEDGTLIIHHDIAHLIETKARKITYGLSNGDFHSISYNTAAFDNSFVTNTSEAYKMAYNGIHNIENALAAIQVAKLFGLSHNQIAQGLAEFKGVKRRFELVAKYGQYTYIDDYAHHPTELKALIESLRAI